VGASLCSRTADALVTAARRLKLDAIVVHLEPAPVENLDEEDAGA